MYRVTIQVLDEDEDVNPSVSRVSVEDTDEDSSLTCYHHRCDEPASTVIYTIGPSRPVDDSPMGYCANHEGDGVFSALVPLTGC